MRKSLTLQYRQSKKGLEEEEEEEEEEMLGRCSSS